MKNIYLAGGCFWGIQSYFDRKDGVVNTVVGYANGDTQNPTYEDVCRKNTNFAEVLYVDYDEKKISLDSLLIMFWKVIDPTSLNRQGGDVGSQYRTGIYYTDIEDRDTIDKSLNAETLKYDKKIVTEVEPMKNFYPAEEYHQKYLDKNPGGYCHIDLDIQ